MTSPAIRPNQPAAANTIQPHGNHPAPATTPASPEDARDSAISDISAARAQPRRVRTPSWTRAADQVARAYEDNHSAADVHELLRQNPDIMRAIASGPADAIESRMADLVGFLDGPNALSAVQTFVEGAVRDSVATHAQRTIRGGIRRSDALRTDVLSNLDRYRNAPTGTAEAKEMATLNLNGNFSEAEVHEAFDTVVEGFEALAERFEGQAWEVGDFPNSARAAIGRLRLRGHTAESTLAHRAIRDTSGSAETVATHTLHTAHVALELPHIVHALAEGVSAAALPVAVLAGGLALGMAIHHGAEEVRDEAITLAHSLDIR